ncbi:MAG: hypothetical protein Q9210_001587 [Variospora velana]
MILALKTLALLLLAHHYLHLATAWTLPLRRLNAPPPPSGFKMQLHYEDSDRPLNPLGIYICAIQAMAQWSGPAWDSLVHDVRDIDHPGLKVGITLVPFAGPGEPHQLRLSHVLMGLYQAVLEITAQSRFRVFGIRLLHVDAATGRVDTLGLMEFRPGRNSPPAAAAAAPPPPRRIGSKRAREVSSSLAASGSENMTAGVVVVVSGHFVHPVYPWLTLDWTFDGQKIRVSEIFTCILDAIISTADEPGSQQRSSVLGVSLQGDTVLHMNTVDQMRLSNQGTQNVLLMVAREIFEKERRFEEVDFRFTDHGRVAAEGWFLKMKRNGGEGVEGVGVEE